jgi:hypothetical protein
MTEHEWLLSTDPQAMFRYLLADHAAKTPPRLARHPRVSDRKLRLFACACCRQVWPAMTDSRSRQTVEIAERFAEGLASEQELATAWVAAWNVAEVTAGVAARAVAEAAAEASASRGASRDPSRDASRARALAASKQAPLLRDIVGNPFRPLHINSAWLTWSDRIIPRLAQVAYDDRHDDGTLDAVRLAVLADALEEAGCDNADILSHLRQPQNGIPLREAVPGKCWTVEIDNPWGPHVRGCWVLDLLLGKE